MCIFLLLDDEKSVLLADWMNDVVAEEGARFLQQSTFKMHVYAESIFSLLKVAVTRL